MLLILACHPASLSVETPALLPVDSAEDSPVPSDSMDSVELIEEAPHTPPENDWLFGLDQVHQVELSLAPGGLDSLRSDPRTFVLADLRVDDREVKGIGVRIKGRLGSLRSVDQSPGSYLSLGVGQRPGSRGGSGFCPDRALCEPGSSEGDQPGEPSELPDQPEGMALDATTAPLRL